ncbi:hypothetical protein HMPREF1318_2234 [Actinomyces massiliensis F0489]|uniref:Uncharacterized protein n=1 Tax=Actinomyces massiliensis F0489 TaxID=1125718 RepID=J0MQ83_9ACTO|nr:hypothetical protein HMPREF1318_2234 [Actinomyces massiliensis F0489]
MAVLHGFLEPRDLAVAVPGRLHRRIDASCNVPVLLWRSDAGEQPPFQKVGEL